MEYKKVSIVPSDGGFGEWVVFVDATYEFCTIAKLKAALRCVLALAVRCVPSVSLLRRSLHSLHYTATTQDSALVGGGIDLVIRC